MIGPNGAGKTTLISQLTGAADARRRPHPFRRPATSRALPAYRRAQLGLARSFQITSLLPDFTRARQRRAGGAGACRPLASVSGAMRASEPAAARAGARRARRVGLADARRRAGRAALSHGEQRQLELAMALATSRACCCSTSRWPAWARASPRAWSTLLRELKARSHDPAGRARHGRGVRARRPHLGAGLRPRHRHRHAGRDPRQRARCARPISAKQDDAAMTHG